MLNRIERSKQQIRRGRKPCKWGQTELALLRSYSDQEVAKITGRTISEVAAKRRSL